MFVKKCFLTRSVRMERGLCIRETCNKAIQLYTEPSSLLPNTHSFVKSWQKQLAHLFALKNYALLQFLDKPIQEWPCMADRPIEQHDASVQIDLELGMPLSKTTEELQKIMELYKTTVDKLFEANESLHKKLDKLAELRTRLEAIHDLEEPTKESLQLQTSILDYVQSRYSSLQIKEDFTTFCELHSRFTALRSVVHMLYGFAQHMGPMNVPFCTICTTGRIAMTLIPCGHTFCGDCGSKQRNQCFICRTTIKDKQKIYCM